MFGLSDFISSSLNPKVPSLSNYNKLKMGISYKECRNVLKVEGHSTNEKDNEIVYEWYDSDCEDGLFKKMYKDVEVKEIENGLSVVINLDINEMSTQSKLTVEQLNNLTDTSVDSMIDEFKSAGYICK